jgi:hypothetical protein
MLKRKKGIDINGSINVGGRYCFDMQKQRPQ